MTHFLDMIEMCRIVKTRIYHNKYLRDIEVRFTKLTRCGSSDNVKSTPQLVVHRASFMVFDFFVGGLH
jgi:hypothetical protein